LCNFKRAWLFVLFICLSNNVFATSQAELLPPIKNVELKNEKISAKFWLDKMKDALTRTQFEAGVVRLKGKKTESFQWVHGVLSDGQAELEVERISALIGTGNSTIRVNNIVTFIEPNKEPASVYSDSIRNVIPPIFYKDVSELTDSYQFVMVSRSQIAGRSAQLIRIESIDKNAYNYWIWIDVASGLPLRLAFVDEKSEVIEQVLMTHLTLHKEPTPAIKELAGLNLPPPPNSSVAQNQETGNWQITWLPKGFKLLKNDRHHISISREVSDYYLFGDGLAELSIYVQRPLESFSSPLALNDGATSFVMLHADGFDVTVVGKVPLEAAYKIAASVKSP
jgi:sigma-E factor negative regulatory protein RseB